LSDLEISKKVFFEILPQPGVTVKNWL